MSAAGDVLAVVAYCICASVVASVLWWAGSGVVKWVNNDFDEKNNMGRQLFALGCAVRDLERNAMKAKTGREGLIAYFRNHDEEMFPREHVIEKIAEMDL